MLSIHMDKTFLVKRRFEDFPGVIPEDFEAKMTRYLNNHYDDNKSKFVINELNWDLVKFAATTYLNAIPLRGGHSDALIINPDIKAKVRKDYAVKFGWVRVESIRANLTDDVLLMDPSPEEVAQIASTIRQRKSQGLNDPLDIFKRMLKCRIESDGLINKIEKQMLVVFATSSKGVRMCIFETDKRAAKNIRAVEKRRAATSSTPQNSSADPMISFGNRVDAENVIDSSLGFARVCLPDNKFTIRLFADRVGKTILSTKDRPTTSSVETTEPVETTEGNVTYLQLAGLALIIAIVWFIQR